MTTEFSVIESGCLKNANEYIDKYGLTPKRVYAFWFMAVLALIFMAFGETIYNNVNTGYKRNSIIDNAANDKYVVDGPDLKKELDTSNE